jgi:hypothetical protein
MCLASADTYSSGKLWLSLGYDVNGYEQGAIEGFWAEVQSLVREVLL